MTEKRTCNCEPEVFDDGSKMHADECPVFPWCPHEVGYWACIMPCDCPCSNCKALEDAWANG